MDDRPLKLLLVGDFDTAEMQPVLAAATHRLPGAHRQRAATPDAAMQLVQKQQSFADMVVVALAWPDQWSAAHVAGLLGALPLARFICAYGLWCESDGRNRSIWPAAVRVPAQRAPGRIRCELDVLAGRRPALPLTASAEEAYEFDIASTCPATTLAGKSVGVCSRDARLRMTIEDALRSAGSRIVDPFDQSAHVDAVTWDVDPSTRSQADEMRSFRRSRPHVPVVALTNHARPEDLAALASMGVRSTVSKLSPLDEMLMTLDDALA